MTTKRKFTLHVCLVMFHDKFFYRRLFPYTYSPILLFALFVDFHCCTMPFFPAMMNFSHFLWIVSHIFSFACLFLIILNQRVYLYTFSVCEMQIIFIEKKDERDRNEGEKRRKRWKI